MIRTKGEKAFAWVNALIMLLISFVMLYPMWHILMSSVSDPILLYADRGVYLLPKGTVTFQGYKLVLQNPNISSGFLNTGILVFFGTMLCMVTTIMGSYVLSRRGLYWNKLIMKLIIFTMYFGGGLIPYYIQVKNMELLNTHWAILLPCMINTWNLIVLRTAFAGVSESLIESAKIDAASDWRILWQIVVPVAKPTIAVITLFYAVQFWNEWFNPSLFYSDKKMWPLQLVLREILLANDTKSMTSIADVGTHSVQNYKMLVKYCTIIVATVPILVVYPLVQKYFVAGVMVGSVKE